MEYILLLMVVADQGYPRVYANHESPSRHETDRISPSLLTDSIEVSDKNAHQAVEIGETLRRSNSIILRGIILDTILLTVKHRNIWNRD